jgi:hypothetical protein
MQCQQARGTSVVIAACAACRYDSGMTGAASEDAWRARLAEVIDAFNAAGREILASPDGEEAYRRATELMEIRAGQEGMQAWLRARGAAWIRDAAGMTFAELAEKLGLSRSRAQQFAEMARRDRSGEV